MSCSRRITRLRSVTPALSSVLHDMISEWIGRLLPPFRGHSILDIGPGYGDFSRVVAQITGAMEVTYVDYSEEILNWQRDRAVETGLVPRLIKDNLTTESVRQLPGNQDIILCQEILEHLVEAPMILAALTDRLSEKGRIIITVPTRISERLLKLVNPSYMRDEPYGHVHEFDRKGLLSLIRQAGLDIEVFFPTQPHYFLAHLWLFGTRVKVDGFSGRILSKGIRTGVFSLLVRSLRLLFWNTAPRFWGHVFPRNYFVIARREKITRM